MCATDSRDYTLDISEPLFRLTTEGIRLHSNETLHHRTLSELIDQRAPLTAKIKSHDKSTIKQHFTSIPSGGDIRIHLTISDSSAMNLDNAKELLGVVLDSEVSLADALSALLFDYVVEQKAARVLEKINSDNSKTRRPQDTVNGASD